MLDLPRYLLGVAELLLIAAAAGFAAHEARRVLLPDFTGAPALLGTLVLASALLLWTAELLGSFVLFKPLPYMALTAAAGVATGTLLRGWRRARGGRGRLDPQGPPEPGAGTPGRSSPDPSPGPSWLVVIALAIATVALLHFAADARPKLTTGMTGFDSTWYHGPFAAGFYQSASTWNLHYIAPQFLTWFYPANAELAGAIGMLAFGRDLLSPLLNIGWFAACLLACWCVGRPFRVAPWSLALGALALSVPALSDQAGEARSDLAGTFFLLAGVAVALNARFTVREAGPAAGGWRTGALLVVGLAAGLAAGTKLNLLLPGAVLVFGLAVCSPPGRRARALGAPLAAALAGGGYWYLRNLAHAGNPLPWFDNLGPLSLPAPAQELGGREAHSVASYLDDGGVWSDWLLPGLHSGLTLLWPLLAGLSLAGLLAAAIAGFRSWLSPCGVKNRQRSGADRRLALGLAGLVGLAVALAWLLAPTSASGPEGMPRGFESGLRYLAPALVLGLALLPLTPLWPRSHFVSLCETKCDLGGEGRGRRGAGARHGPPLRWVVALAAAAAIALGYPVQRHYLENRYAAPTFSAPGLDAAFAYARDLSGARIATTSTRQYPLLGTDLSNRVDFVGERRAHGGFVAPTTCRTWRRLLNEGDYDYVLASRDRVEPGAPPYPATARWTADPDATVVLRKPPTVLFKLPGPLDPSRCPARP